MKDNLDELVKELDKAKAEAQKAEGALEAALERLKDEFGCADIAAAEKQLNKLKKKADILEEEYEEAYLEAQRIMDGEEEDSDEDSDEEEYEEDDEYEDEDEDDDE